MSKKSVSSLSEERKCSPFPLEDLVSDVSNTSGHHLPPSSSRRIRKRNPFSERRRDNFPDINDVFKSAMTTSSEFVGNEIYDNDKSDFVEDDEEECCRFSDIDGSSVLNMSIGARAAMTEHARFVAKYGIDGEINQEVIRNDVNSSRDEIYSDVDSNILLERQWEKLLDLSQAASSTGGSGSGGIPSPPNSATASIYLDSSSTKEKRSEQSSSIEVMTDVSCDYFNSSRVKLLFTPDRNKNRRTEMIITRNGDGVEYMPLDHHLISPFVGDPDDRCIHDETKFTIGHGVNRSRGDVNSRESSFNIGDISRISSNTVSDTNRTQDESFHSYHRQNARRTDTDFDELISIYPSNMLNDDSSFFSNQMEEVPEKLFSDIKEKEGSPFDCSFYDKHHFQKEPFPIPGKDTTSTEKMSQVKSADSSSSIQSTVSGFIAEVRSITKQVLSDVEKSIGAMDSLSNEFLRSMDIGRTDAPSPISNALSSPTVSSESRKTEQERGFANSLNADCSHISSSSSIGTRIHNNTSSSISSAGVGDTIQIHLTGRKRYRTVVPRRVYLDVPEQYFDEEQDSFIASLSNPEAPLRGVSLLESFDEAATCSTF